jgi:hypothetical protein
VDNNKSIFYFKEENMCQKTYFLSSSGKTIFTLVFLLVSASVFADMTTNYSETVKDIGGLSVILNQILGFFRSNYMKAIVSIALGGLAIGMIMNRGEPGMVKKFIPWIAGCTLLLSLSAIVEIVFNTK